MTLPLLISVPHAGWRVPNEAASYCRLTTNEIEQDGDEGAAEIYALQQQVAEFITTEIARAIVDLNRATDDRRADGVVKTHTCWKVPVYHEFPPEAVVEELLDRYYHPYHADLDRRFTEDTLLAVDCHTMAAAGPPIGPDSGQARPWVCLGDDHGRTLPDGWIDRLADCFRSEFDGNVTVNEPFSGGYITRTHGRQHPWMQLELSRAPFLPNPAKRSRVLAALSNFCAGLSRT